jgi:hypothetical protein
MTSLLSAISGHFNRALIFGTVVPLVLFMTLGGWLLQSWLPAESPWRALQAYGTEWQAAAALVAIALASSVLHSVNVPLTRLYEGYPWEHSFVGRRRIAKYRVEHRRLTARWLGYRAVRYAIEGDGAFARAGTQILGEHSRVGRVLADRFPDEPHLLPTRLGNAIRAFESYPSIQYGMSAITLWPRLVAVIGEDYANAIAEQKTSFDFMLNSSALAMLTAAVIAAIGLIFPLPFVSMRWLFLWVVEVFGLVALAYWFYEGSIGRAVAWGQMVKGAFDIYRHQLLKKLGYDATPPTRAAERHLWQMISQQIIYGDTRRVHVPPLTADTSYVEVIPAWLSVTVHRSVELPDAVGKQRIHVTLANNDPSNHAVTKVALVERLPVNTDLIHSSVQPMVAVEGVNPIRIPLGSLAAGATVAVQYEVVRYKV